MPVTNTVTDPENNPLSGIEVIAEAVTTTGDPYPLFDGANETGIVSRVTTETDDDGTWTLTLPAPGDMTPSASYYRITERLAPFPDVQYNIRPVTGDEWVGDILVNPPDDITLVSGAAAGPLKAHYASNDDTAPGKLLGFYSTANNPQDLFADNTWRAHPGGAAFDISIGGVSAGEILRVLIDGVVVAPTADTDNRVVLDFSAATIDALGDPLNFIHAPSGGIGTEPNAGIHDVTLTGDGMQLFGLVDYVVSAEDIIDGAVSVRAFYRFAEVGSPGEVRLIADQTRSFNFGVLHLEPYDA